MACKECNVGTYVKSGHGTSIRDCEVCPEGTNQSIQAGFRACRCKVGYARTDRYGPCFVCLIDKGLDCTNDFRLLAYGYFWYWNFSSANITSYRLFVSNLKDESKNISLYTNYTSEIPSTFRCPRTQSCPNTNGEIQGQCAEGYTGWLCTRCLPGYYSVLNTCIKCPEKSSLILEIGAFVSVCVFICFLFSWQLKRDAKRDRQSRSFLDVVISRVKILLGFYQVVGEIFASVHDISWKGPLVIIGTFISSLELNILRIFVRPRCISEMLVINPKIEFIIGVSCPVVIITIPLCIYQTRKLYLKCKRFFYSATQFYQSNLKNLRTRLITCVIVLLFLFYPPICSVIFELYPRACKTFYLDKDKIYNVTRLRANYDFDCEDLAVYQTCAYIFTGVYVVMFPAVLLYMLWLYVPRTSKPSTSRIDQQNSFSQEEGNHDDELTPLVINDANSRSQPAPLWLSFLCENYKEKYWFWEIIELSRKVTQTLLITLCGWEDRLTVLMTTCISVLFLLLHAWYRPMKESNEQRLQMFSLTVIFINVLVAANDVQEDDYEESISVILILLNILVLVIIVGEVLMTLVVHIKHSKLSKIFVVRFRKFRLRWKRYFSTK
ncbi:hypothetical protein HOLleu_20417 [Holothuria leucospilota]|uniref:DUF7630 domain-containing protein n=1 Tax=Holothuria leucospilota TaxID=206669 RepID=A0A9Q1C1C8_HOLLE|nr:hypothetical protein HOLleu_20417 [Holothuria leucospilota]